MRTRLPAIISAYVLIALLAVSCSDDSSGPSGSGISMDDAIDIVKNDIIPAETPQDGKYICLRMSGSIPKGSTIEEDAPAGGSGSIAAAPRASFAVDEESYFFFLDLDPYSFYEHPVKYIVIEKSSGSYGVTDALWWPKINGSTPSQFLAAVPDPDYVVEDTANLPAPIEEEMTFPFGNLNLIWKEGFIAVQGLMPDEKLYGDATTTYQNALNFFNAYKNSFSRVEGLAEAQADNVPAVIDDMVSEGIDLITIHIISHGGSNRIRLAGHWISATTFSSKMAQYPDVLFNFLLGSCHGGSFIDDLRTLDNVRVVMTACAADESAWPDWDNAEGLTDYNPLDSGSEWTSSILWAARVIALNTEWLSIVKDLAGTHGVPVTCELLFQAHYGAIGLNSGMNLYYNLDLSCRTDHATPQLYHSWPILR